jgi:hypothetical protein
VKENIEPSIYMDGGLNVFAITYFGVCVVLIH